jgi:NAD-dependent SIR2 family protein deacetylase
LGRGGADATALAFDGGAVFGAPAELGLEDFREKSGIWRDDFFMEPPVCDGSDFGASAAARSAFSRNVSIAPHCVQT